ncbi:MAG: TIGR02757 family protein [Candidatus Rokubacteria bacterium]|nr:TIGR02757 family protein [Candidatus Rokubacteria bacterium]
MRSPPPLEAALDRLHRGFDWAGRTPQDAIRHPLRYADPGDREVAGLLAACLAYGRVDLFGPQVDWALGQMGESPRRFVLGFDPRKDGARFDGFRYRFNRPRDLAAFCLATQRILLAHDSLGAFFARGYSPGDPDVGPALQRFVDGFLGQDLSAVFPRNRLSRGFRHLFPRPSTGGPCKRLHLFLRWMVRRQAPDFGLWTAIPPSALLMPVDTHVEHMARALRLTRRRSRNWKMVEEITARLRVLDPEDPVKYDFALCHKRMSGDCLDRRDAVVCAPCDLKPVCRHWQGWRGAAAGEPSAYGDPPRGARGRGAAAGEPSG